MTTIRGLDRVTAKLGNLQNFSRWAYRPMEETVSLLHDEIAKAPRKAQDAFSDYATPAQKRAYWARVRSGEISHREGVGYVRSNTLGRKWVTRVENTPSGVRGVIGNNVAYVEYVQSKARQQRFHAKSGWVTDERAIEETADAIATVWRRAVNEVLSK